MPKVQRDKWDKIPDLANIWGWSRLSRFDEWTDTISSSTIKSNTATFEESMDQRKISRSATMLGF
jgi:hypothetical protein